MADKSQERSSTSIVDNSLNARAIEGKSKSRLDWVDYAKGFCIIMVVMMHSTHDVANQVGREGFMYYIVAFAKPFRMPDFFLISGLFLANVINRDWKTFLDRKVIHFVYFYALWVTIQFGLKLPGIVSNEGVFPALLLYLKAFIQPPGTMWFIYVLPIFFLVTRLLKNVQPPIVFLAAILLEIARVDTGWTIIDQSASRFVYFYAGYWLAPQIFNLAAWAQRNTRLAVLATATWAVLNSVVVFGGWGDTPVISLILGFVGAAAIITIAALLANVSLAEPIRYCGRNSIVIYLAFFLPMILARVILLQTRIVPSVGATALIVSVAAIVCPLLLWRVVRNTKLSFLFKRPTNFSLDKPATNATILDVRTTV